MAKQNYSHIGRLWPAIKHSWLGLKAAYKHEIAFRQEVFLALVLLPLAAWLAADFVEFAILASGVFGIMITELLNSGIEAAIDRIGTEHHELSGRAKDLGSAAVFMSIIYFVLVWGYKLVTLLFPAVS
ncbi:diacylglycerol kinase [Thalassotalea agarivorans]|uniref:Diacylglycerol kinase n=1 Tax=Thalassotalea agarivorans TaxID=349064 RepID=A0A1I0GEN8_THASX|nr:diacylglycerol kinase [Thalassotalea agarivorans]SET69290.1 diacylglycerol kinase (ATP) [Thalassotalea agarivorans]